MQNRQVSVRKSKYPAYSASGCTITDVIAAAAKAIISTVLFFMNSVTLPAVSLGCDFCSVTILCPSGSHTGVLYYTGGKIAREQQKIFPDVDISPARIECIPYYENEKPRKNDSHMFNLFCPDNIVRCGIYGFGVMEQDSLSSGDKPNQKIVGITRIEGKIITFTPEG